MEKEILQNAANQARGLALDAIHKAGLGHLGLPTGCAEIGATEAAAEPVPDDD